MRLSYRTWTGNVHSCASYRTFRLCLFPLHRLLNRPPNEADPPPAASPSCLASLHIQSTRNCLSASFLASITLVLTRASPAAKLSSVGTEVIAYSEASGGPGTEADIISGASNWTGAKSTPPWDSPTPEVTRLRRRGSMERQEGHQEVVQRVRRGAWREVERERMELKEAGVRILHVLMLVQQSRCFLFLFFFHPIFCGREHGCIEHVVYMRLHVWWLKRQNNARNIV